MMTTDDARPYTYTFQVQREALDVMQACYSHIAKLADYYGSGSTIAAEAHSSWDRNMLHMFTSPFGQDTHVSKDFAPLSLIVTGGGIQFGIIWHGEKRVCKDPECAAIIEDDGQVWSHHRFSGITILDHEHLLSRPMNAPQPGTWSFHS